MIIGHFLKNVPTIAIHEEFNKKEEKINDGSS